MSLQINKIIMEVKSIKPNNSRDGIPADMSFEPTDKLRIAILSIFEEPGNHFDVIWPGQDKLLHLYSEDRIIEFLEISNSELTDLLMDEEIEELKALDSGSVSSIINLIGRALWERAKVDCKE